MQVHLFEPAAAIVFLSAPRSIQLTLYPSLRPSMKATIGSAALMSAILAGAAPTKDVDTRDVDTRFPYTGPDVPVGKVMMGAWSLRQILTPLPIASQATGLIPTLTVGRVGSFA